MNDVLGHWSAAHPAEIAELFKDSDFPWWIAGGYAIELAAGREIRPHGDVDVLVLRRDQERVRERLADWDLYVADPPRAGQLRPWARGEFLDLPLNGLWCRRSPSAPWSVELLLDESDADQWVSRRDARVRLPLDHLGQVSAEDIPYLAPEVQLFYKAKATREKDQADFEAVVPLLGPAQRAWLLEALDLCEPKHPWRERLTAGNRGGGRRLWDSDEEAGGAVYASGGPGAGRQGSRFVIWGSMEAS
ncbi:nucleotidyltransferase domain-containing protein [Streptomyces sp. NPDC094438]|uniref:nucleotidyltransferase domain-containing protein n=1 Tax=Streptomyces sp. NPDC094438 TaxID=3366061 RepID=UPI00381ED98D